jgi:protein TonB
MADTDTLAWDGPIALSVQHTPHRSIGLAVLLHGLVAAALLAWPAAEPPGDSAPVVEIIFAPPPPVVEPEPPAPQPQPVAKPATLAPVAPAKAAPAKATPAKVAASALKPSATAAPAPAAESAPAAEAPTPAGAASSAAAATPAAPPASADMLPTAIDTPRPSYPLAARRKGWEGVVVLAIEVDLLGCPTAVTIKASSGHTALDDAAVDAARRWHFNPAQRNGKPTVSAVEVPVRFSLKDA